MVNKPPTDPMINRLSWIAVLNILAFFCCALIVYLLSDYPENVL